MDAVERVKTYFDRKNGEAAFAPPGSDVRMMVHLTVSMGRHVGEIREYVRRPPSNGDLEETLVPIHGVVVDPENLIPLANALLKMARDLGIDDHGEGGEGNDASSN